MAEKNKKPEIRFTGFTDAWEQRKYSETFTKIPNNTLSRAELNYNSGLAKNVHYGDVLIKFGELLDIEKDEIPYITDGALVNKFRTSKLQSGDVIIADAAEDETVGKCTELVNVGEETVISGLHTIPSRPTLSFVSGYLGYFMNSPAYHTQLIRLMQGTKVTSISKAALQDTAIFYPIDSVEQCKISKFFQQLNNLITLQQRKYDKLIIVKKSMLEKMFPNGANIPEIRFATFTDAWDQREVGELLIERNTQSPKSDEYPLMAFVAYKGVAPKGDRYNREFLVNDEFNKKYKQTEYGDFIYSSNNLTTGSIGLNNYGKASISPVYSIFQPSELADPDFIGRLLVRKSFINQMVRWRQGVIYGQWRIHESDFVKIEIKAPLAAEQKQIGTFFKRLDNLIILHLSELKKLKNIKKSMLEKMFV